MTGQHGEKVRHSSNATDGDSVAAWVEPSEGVSVEYVCMCVLGWGVTPGYHDNQSRAGWPAWLLLGGLLEFSSGMPPKPISSCGLSQEATWRAGSWEKGGATRYPFTDSQTEQHTTYNKDQTENPAIPKSICCCCCFYCGKHSDSPSEARGGKHLLETTNEDM